MSVLKRWNGSDWEKIGPAIENTTTSTGSGITEEIKQALLQLASKVAYIDENGQTYYNGLYNALYNVAISSITAVYTQSGTVYDTDSLDVLRDDLVVTVNYVDGTSETVTYYTLSGTLTTGTSIITVSYGRKTDTFTVTVTEAPPYTFYDYIRTVATTGSYPANGGILTDISMTSEDTLETEILVGASNSAACNIMGIRNGQTGTKEFGLFVSPNSGKLGYWYGGTDTTQSFNPFSSINTRYVIKVQPVGVSQTYPTYATINVNGTDYNTGSTATGQTWHAWLGFFKYGISATQTSTNTNDAIIGLHIGKTTIKNSNGVVIHNLIPAYDGTYYGLYDSVEDKFYYNATYSSNYTCGNWT